MPDYGERATLYPPGSVAGYRWRIDRYGAPHAAVAGTMAVNIVPHYTSGSLRSYSQVPRTFAGLTVADRRYMTIADATWDNLYAYVAVTENTAGGIRFESGSEWIRWALTQGRANLRADPAASSTPVSPASIYTAIVSPSWSTRAPAADWSNPYVFLDIADTTPPVEIWARVVESSAIVRDDSDLQSVTSRTQGVREFTLETRWNRNFTANMAAKWRGEVWRVVGLSGGDDRKRTVEIDVSRTDRVN